MNREKVKRKYRTEILILSLTIIGVAALVFMLSEMYI
jgi:hypothetical protein